MGLSPSKASRVLRHLSADIKYSSYLELYCPFLDGASKTNSVIITERAETGLRGVVGGDRIPEKDRRTWTPHLGVG